MEIGYGRARPYQQVEARDSEGARPWFIKGRKRVRNITYAELFQAYPSIASCMEQIVLETRESWQNKGRWWIAGMEGRSIERGVRFSVSHEDRTFYEHMLREDLRYREKRYLSGHRKRIRRYLRAYTYINYTPAELRSYKNAQRIARLFKQSSYTPFYRSALIRAFPKVSRLRGLTEQIVGAFNIDMGITKEEEQLLDSVSMLQPFRNLHVYRPPRQPGVHARGMMVFEVLLESRFRAQNEVPF